MQIRRWPLVLGGEVVIQRRRLPTEAAAGFRAEARPLLTRLLVLCLAVVGDPLITSVLAGEKNGADGVLHGGAALEGSSGAGPALALGREVVDAARLAEEVRVPHVALGGNQTKDYGGFGCSI